MGTEGSGSSIITMVVTLVLFLLFLIAFPILNSSIAKRKGKSRALFGWFSVIPLVGFFLLFYLISLPEKELMDKIDKILAKTEMPK